MMKSVNYEKSRNICTEDWKCRRPTTNTRTMGILLPMKIKNDDDRRIASRSMKIVLTSILWRSIKSGCRYDAYCARTLGTTNGPNADRYSRQRLRKQKTYSYWTIKSYPEWKISSERQASQKVVMADHGRTVIKKKKNVMDMERGRLVEKH